MRNWTRLYVLRCFYLVDIPHLRTHSTNFKWAILLDCFSFASLFIIHHEHLYLLLNTPNKLSLIISFAFHWDLYFRSNSNVNFNSKWERRKRARGNSCSRCESICMRFACPITSASSSTAVAAIHHPVKYHGPCLEKIKHEYSY